MRLTLLLLSTGVLAATPLAARDRTDAEFARPYGMNYGQETEAYDADTRDANGNRVILGGRIVVGSDLSTLPRGLYADAAGSTGSAGNGTAVAVGNQLNVITNGNNNTVIVNATQTNTGDVTATLNGQVNLDD